jgi:transcriptional regulator with XRE-family HTH domain
MKPAKPRRRRHRRSELAAEATRRNLEQLSKLGADAKASRLRQGWTQRELGGKVGLAHHTVGLVERGLGGNLSVDTWQRIGLALDRPLIVGLPRDPNEEPADVGHLRIQELVLRLGRATGRTTTFELPTRPSDPTASADVGLGDRRLRVLVLTECWNTIGDIGAAARSTTRKVAEAEQLAVVRGGEGQTWRVASVWVVRASRRNRDLVRRYPEVFAARFPGSSAAWVRSLTTGTEPPEAHGLVWCDVACTRLFAWRRR